MSRSTRACPTYLLLSYSITLLSTLMLSMGVVGQSERQLKLSWGEEVRAQKKSSLYQVIGLDEGRLYSIETTDKGSRSHLVMYDETFDKKKSRDLHHLLHMGTNDKLYEVMLFNHCLYAVMGRLNGKKKTFEVLLQRIDKEQLTLDGKARRVAEVAIKGFRYNGRVFVHRSPSDEKALILFDLETKDKDSLSLAGVVFDSFMQEENRYQSTVGDRKLTARLAAFEVDDVGRLHLLYRISRASGQRAIDAFYTLYSPWGNGQMEKVAEVRSIDRYLNDMDVVATSSGRLIITGTTSEDFSDGISGTIYLEIDPTTGQVIENQESTLSTDVLLKGMNANQQRRAQKELDKGEQIELGDYYLRRVIPSDNGGAILLTEQEFTRRSTAQGTFYDPTMIATTYYHYNDILVIHLDPSGRIDWSHKVLKRQMSTNDDGFYSSFASAYVDSTLYLMYHDDPQNAFVEDLEFLRTSHPGSEDGVVDLVTIDSQGRMGQSIFMKNMNSPVILRPKVMLQTDDDRMVIYGESKRSRRYGLLRFD